MLKRWAGVFALAVGAMGILGYHPGLEDDAYYLAAIKWRLNPALFPHDADFFRLQFQATVFDRLIAGAVWLTHLPLGWVALVWQFGAALAVLAACLRIAGRCFAEESAQWGGVGMVAALLTIPVSGTGIAIMDQHLHPRNLATALILWAVAMTLERRVAAAGALLALAASVHAIMASFGVSLCLFLAFPEGLRGAAMLLPLGWLFDPTTEAWKRAAATRSFYFPMRWEWYEWLGVIAPVGLLWLFGQTRLEAASPDGSADSPVSVADHVPRAFSPALTYLPPRLSNLRWLLGRRVAWFAVFQLAVALALMLPPGLERLRPLEPMRYLQLVYILMFLLMGGIVGKYLLKTIWWRWALLFAPLTAGMLYAQLDLYPATAHFEWPGAASSNRWVRAFAWIGRNTPEDSYFALNPEYMALPGEDFHGFRALAERSALADNLKDPGMAARVPRLAERWLRETEAQRGWRNFTAEDFRRLKARFGIDWVIVENPSLGGLPCPYRDGNLRVCRIE